MLERIYKAQRTMDMACEKLGRELRIMEVCGTHTVSIFRNGIKTTLNPMIKLISGPGCPVCVTDQSYIDIVLELARRPDVLIATYGDMMRVPGRDSSLEQQRSRNRNVHVVLSAMDAVKLAASNPDKTVVFVAVGFETTTPATAVAVREARNTGLKNFTIYSGHKLVIPAMKALLSNQDTKLDAFLCPGHVSVIIGSDAYLPIARDYGKPCVVAGFEPMQIIEGLAEICRLMIGNRADVASIYSAAVTPAGNRTAWGIIEEHFTAADGLWRGVGTIPASSLVLREEYADFDALKKFGITEEHAEEPQGCSCGAVLCGLMEPPECPLFAKSCTPDSPVGPCMVSSEGSCAAWYKYSGRRKKA